MSGNLTYAQLEGVWIQAGGSPSMAPLMAAIAEAESKGDPTAQNDDDNDGTQSSFGLWQISTGTHAPPSPNWADPVTNARLAIQKLNTQGLGAWGTYASGEYKAYLSSSTTPDTSFTSSSVPTNAETASSTSDPSTCLIGLNASTGSTLGFGGPSINTCFLSKTQGRAVIGGLMIASGLILFVMGSVTLVAFGFKKTGAANTIAQTVPLYRKTFNVATKGRL
jgi:hypothetical protein